MSCASKMAVMLLGGLAHLGGSCRRTDLIEFQWRIAGDVVPLNQRAPLSDDFRKLLESAEGMGLLRSFESKDETWLKITRLGTVLVGLVVTSGIDIAAGAIESPEHIELLKKICKEGVSAIQMDHRQARPKGGR